MTNKEKFKEVYTKNLTEMVKANPKAFFYKTEDVPKVVGKVMQAIEDRKIDKSGPVMQKTMKELSILNTYKELYGWWEK